MKFYTVRLKYLKFLEIDSIREKHYKIHSHAVNYYEQLKVEVRKQYEEGDITEEMEDNVLTYEIHTNKKWSCRIELFEQELHGIEQEEHNDSRLYILQMK